MANWNCTKPLFYAACYERAEREGWTVDFEHDDEDGSVSAWFLKNGRDVAQSVWYSPTEHYGVRD